MSDYEQQERESNKKHAKHVDARKSDLLDVLSTQQGRRFVIRIMSDCGLMSSLPAHDDAVLRRQLGKRDVAVNLLEEIAGIDKDLASMIMAESMKGDK